MLQCVNKELLVNETNSINITSYKDTNGDGRADVKKLVFEDQKYKPADLNMEHQRSGLDWIQMYIVEAAAQHIRLPGLGLIGRSSTTLVP